MHDTIIVGAGIGGLVLALQLHQGGWNCLILEAASELKLLGAGINLMPYAVRELDKLGIGRALRLRGVVPKEGHFSSRAGQVLCREHLGTYAGLEHPQISIHRAALHQILLKEVRERLGADSIMLGCACTGFVDGPNGVAALVPGRPEPFSASILVGCDGIHSMICRQLHPRFCDLNTSRIRMWRGVTCGAAGIGLTSVSRVGHIRTGKLVAYPIRLVDPPFNIALNWVAELQTDDCDFNTQTFCGVPETCLGVRVGEVEFRQIVAETETILEYPMVDRDPLPTWGAGRVTLLGDAAHPMFPVGSNGAGQAILDAAELRRSLQEYTGNPVCALRAYEERRRASTARIVLSDRSGGPDVILDEIQRITSGNKISEARCKSHRRHLESLLADYRSETR